ncbi:MAG: hypothetical protein M1832_000575 [Thelocarpon impressellum]|nr:MAG: hypothetical protein M1832_000575 [Thelocarpon impressellum]
MPRPDPRIAQQQEFFRQRQHFQQIHERQSRYLEDLARVEVPRAAIEPEELERREEFRLSLEDASRRAITEHERIHGHEDFDPATIALKCFGSLSSGFATKASDMDLVLLSPASHPSPCSVLSPIPRILEKAFLDMGHGARLLTKTRVPIIKLCEAPSKELMDGLVQERQKWADGPSASEKQESASEGVPNGTNPGSKAETAVKDAAPNESTAEVDLETFLAEIQRFAQEPEENLWAYYRRAKILMENLGVEDVSTKAGAEGSQRLNRVCEAFVDGISDTDLRSRLRGFKSMNFQNNMRSLAGVWYQAEAERFVRSWETRMILEPTESKEQQGETVVKEWRQLQDKVTPDIVNFNRSLHRYWDRLKILPSAKLGLLSQREEDTPDTYYVRCVTMLRELGGRDYAAAPEQPLDSRERDILEQVLRNYLNGLRDGSIRSRVGHHVITNFVLNGSQMTLKELYAQHNAEHQIMRCWAAKEAGMMSEDDRDIVENYAQQIRANGPRSVDTKLANAFQRLVASLKQKRRQNRDRHVDHLELPKEGVGIQCDVNFSNYLALHNTLLLRCYAHCDPRVRQLVLFVKAWTKRRKINSPYHGSLSSYGYVLMVLHYLVNIAEPAVLPNLQLSWMPPSEQTEQPPKEAMFDGYDVRFWRDEDEIKSLAARGLLTRNRETSGSLLRGFFEYYAGQGPHIVGNGFSWQMDVLSLRTPGGLITKRDKGWTGARTTVTEPTQPGQQRKEVRHRYLFAIEDPFETDHNIARTVTHPGIVAIRDEMRRAWRIINQRGREDNRELDVPGEEGLFDAPVDYEEMAQKTLDAAKAIEVPATGAIATDGAGQQTST